MGIRRRFVDISARDCRQIVVAGYFVRRCDPPTFASGMKNQKTSATTLRLSLILAAMAAMMSACARPGKQQPSVADQPVIYASALSFISDRSPVEKDFADALLKNLNQLVQDAAIAGGKDSALFAIRADSLAAGGKPPMWGNRTQFLPVFTAGKLDSAVRTSFTYSEDKDSIAHFDFARDFALVVSHPPAPGHGIYSDELSLVTDSSKTLILSLWSMTTDDGETALSGHYWQSAVYAIAKKNFNGLTVVSGRDTVSFSLTR